jgi:E3 ubiquitin-protein ligase synoviolin
MALVLFGSILYSLQHILFGPLRPLETEQLWERGWFAMMEWVFAMSTFRDEFGIWFLVMFMSLFTGKIWGWICESRVEQLDQLAPGGSDQRLWHGRLVASLVIYVGFAWWMFGEVFEIVLLEARPGMTVMFVFEFAILCISAMTTCLRYGIWVQEHRVTKHQIVQAVEARKLEIRKQRQEAEDKLKANPEAEDAPDMDELPKEEDVDENEIETPGWEAKRGWLFALDIISGMCLLLY